MSHKGSRIECKMVAPITEGGTVINAFFLSLTV